MFENCSHSLLRARTRKILVAAVFFALAALLFCRGFSSRTLFTRAERCAYLASLGWEVEPGSEECRELLLPKEFDAVLEEYNRLQLAQGYDLRAAAGRNCLRYCYDLRGCDDWDGRVIAVLFLCRGRVIGGDVHTADPRGFMRPLRETDDL